MILQLVIWMVADHVEPFEVVSKKYFEIRVVSVMVQSRVDVMVICAGIRCVLYFEIFYEDKVFYYLYAFDLTIPAEELIDACFACLVHATDIELSD